MSSCGTSVLGAKDIGFEAAVEDWHLSVPLETERTRLRWHSTDDADDLLVFHSDPDVTRYLPWPVRDRPAVVETLQTKLEQTHLDADGTWLSLAVVEKRTGRVVGEALLSRTSHATRTAEVGYALAAHVQGRGIGSEVVSALLASAWDELPVEQVIAHVDENNVPSCRLLEKLGFQVAGRKGNDETSPLLLYTLGRPHHAA